MPNPGKRVPPPRNLKNAIKLAHLWGHLPDSTRRETLKAATRVLTNHVSPRPKEVTHERL
jgi:hypothetical protein